MESGSPQSSHYCLSFSTELMQRVIVRLGSSLEAEFNSGSAGNVLWPWVRSGGGCILSQCTRRQLCPKSLHFCATQDCTMPYLIGWLSFLPSSFQNVTLKSQCLIFLTMRIFLLNMFLLPSFPLSSLPAPSQIWLIPDAEKQLTEVQEWCKGTPSRHVRSGGQKSGG